MKPVIGSVTVLMGLLMGVTGCANADEKSAKNITVGASQTQSHTNNQSIKPAFDTQTIATLNEPWAMTVIAQANKPIQFLVTQKSGELLLIDETGEKRTISGVPAVAYGGQGGLGDVILAPDFATSHDIYLSYAEAGDNATAGAKVIKATIKDLDSQLPSLVNIRTIWTQTPKVTGQGHFSHKLLISPDKKYLFISSGDRQKFTPAQDMSGNLGKIIRLNLDGSIPSDNPFLAKYGKDNIAAQFWSIGHRNTYGMAFDKQGTFWQHEMGPKGGDELNIIEKGQNYGWPIVSNGDNYDGSVIPDHNTRPEFTAPKVSWTPVISPSALAIYDKGAQHNDFPQWQDKALLSGLNSQALVVVDLDSANQGQSAKELYRYDMGQRIRYVKVYDGQVYLLEDGANARLLKLQPK